MDPEEPPGPNITTLTTRHLNPIPPGYFLETVLTFLVSNLKLNGTKVRITINLDHVYLLRYATREYLESFVVLEHSFEIKHDSLSGGEHIAIIKSPTIGTEGCDILLRELAG